MSTGRVDRAGEPVQVEANAGVQDPPLTWGGVGGPRAGCVRVCVPAPDAIVMR